VTIVTAQYLFAIALTLGGVSTLTGLILQWQRIVNRRSDQGTSKFRSAPGEAVLVLVGAVLVVIALTLARVAYF
jgi:uncharacterized membrane protein